MKTFTKPTLVHYPIHLLSWGSMSENNVLTLLPLETLSILHLIIIILQLIIYLMKWGMTHLLGEIVIATNCFVPLPYVSDERTLQNMAFSLIDNLEVANKSMLTIRSGFLWDGISQCDHILNQSSDPNHLNEIYSWVLHFEKTLSLTKVSNDDSIL